MFATPWGSQLGASRDPLFTQLPETERHAAVEFCFCDLKQKKTKLFDSDLRSRSLRVRACVSPAELLWLHTRVTSSRALMHRPLPRRAEPDVSSPQTSMKVSWNLDHAFEAVQASIADAVETSSWKAVFPECITLETRVDLSIEEQVNAILNQHSASLDALFRQWDVDGKGSFTLTEVNEWHTTEEHSGAGQPCCNSLDSHSA